MSELTHYPFDTREVPAEPQRPPRRYLTVDEREMFRVLGKRVVVRIRIWRAKDITPVVLVSQIKGQGSPRAAITWIANYINETYLQFPAAGILLFEDSDVLGRRYLVQHTFEYFGNEHRLRLYRPQQQVKEWEYLAWALRDDNLQR